MLYTKINDKELTGKPIALCMMPRNFKKMSYIMGFSIPILEYLSQDHDVVIITGKEKDGGNDDLLKFGPVWGIDQIRLSKMKDTLFKRAVEMDGEDNNWAYNKEVLLKEFQDTFGKDYFKNLKKILMIDPIDFILPLTSYVAKKDSEFLCDLKNEFHDTVNEDDEISEEEQDDDDDDDDEADE